MLLAKIIGRLAFQAAFLVKGPSDQGGPSPLGICLFCDQTDQTVTFFFFFKKQNLIFMVGHHVNIPQIPKERVFQI